MCTHCTKLPHKTLSNCILYKFSLHNLYNIANLVHCSSSEAPLRGHPTEQANQMALDV